MKFHGENFHPERDDFKVVLSWGFHMQALTILKSEMEQDYEGNYFFVFDSTEMLGRVVATCVYQMADSDQSDGVFTMTNRQALCFVTTNPMPQFLCVPPTGCSSWVEYERVLAPDEEQSYQYLIDSGQRYVTTAEHERLVVHK